MNGRAGIFHEQKRLDEALAEWQRALAIDPNLPQIHHNCGAALFEAGRCDEAIASYDRALALKPDFAKALHNRVAALSRLMRYEEALATSDRLLALEPDNAGAHHNRGSALSSLMRFGEAVDAYSRALALKPDAVESLENRASVLAYLTRHDEAARDFAHVLVLDPDYTYVRGALQSSRQHCCDWRDYDDAVARLAADAEAGKRVSDPFPFVTTTWSAPAQLRCAQTWVQDKLPPAATPLWRGERYAHDRIRVAYLSADLHEHATAYLLAGVLERHDRARFETIGVSFGPDNQDPMRARLRAAFDRFVDVRDATDGAVAEMLRAMEVDIAVDLKGYTYDSRPAIFALRPAPIHVNYLGFPGTMGAPWMDYLIADDVIVPPEARQWYSERVVWLPDTYQANDNTREIAPETPSRADEGLPESGFVFCSFNNSYKITPPVFDVWMRLLQGRRRQRALAARRQSSGAPQPAPRGRRARRGAGAAGLRAAPQAASPSRAAPARRPLSRHAAGERAHDGKRRAVGGPAGPHLPRGHLRRARRRKPAARGRPAGTGDGVAAGLRSAGAGVGARPRAARRPSRAARARGRASCPLFDTDRLRRHLEAAYVAMWERQQRGDSPAAFAVPGPA